MALISSRQFGIWTTQMMLFNVHGSFVRNSDANRFGSWCGGRNMYFAYAIWARVHTPNKLFILLLNSVAIAMHGVSRCTASLSCIEFIPVSIDSHLCIIHCSFIARRWRTTMQASITRITTENWKSCAGWHLHLHKLRFIDGSEDGVARLASHILVWSSDMIMKKPPFGIARNEVQNRKLTNKATGMNFVVIQIVVDVRGRNVCTSKDNGARCEKHSMIANGTLSSLKSALPERTQIHTEMEHDGSRKITMGDGFAEPQLVVWMQINYCVPLADSFVRTTARNEIEAPPHIHIHVEVWEVKFERI